ncbi:alpha/beta fold hydrolase [Leptospira sarikeiensis]|nr:alpha/beta hydrolase [Leptospira sarikeiensis]
MAEDKAILKLKASETFFQEYYTNDPKDSTKIHWLSTGCNKSNRKPILIFIHGSPGNWVNYLKYLTDPQLLEKYCMYAVDRPGFGKSSSPIPNVNLQADRISTSLLQLIDPKGKLIVLLGHSYGGPVAARMASTSPEIFTHLFLLAAAMDPKFEEVRWYNKIADTGFGKWILPEEWTHSNSEMLSLKEQLEILTQEWKKIKSHTVIVQGEDDGLVDARNTEFIRAEFSPQTELEIILLPKEGHFIPWKNFDLIRKLLLDILK